MITEAVIKEMYRKFQKPPKSRDELHLNYFLNMLGENHKISYDNDEIIVESLDEFNPFRRFLIRSLTGVVEFDKMIAFIFRNHILFFGRNDDQLRVHIKPEEKRSIFSRIFGRG